MCLRDALCSIRFYFDMQHDYFRKMTFDPIPGVEGVYEQNMYLRVAAFVIPLNVICNMTMFWKS